jgi:neutral ceramidase
MAASLLAFGCAPAPPRAPLARKVRDDVFRAAAARADITPPPGLSLFGHGPEGRVSMGTLLRLRCEAFVLSRGEEIAVLLPCDLGAPSLELQRAIAARLERAAVPIRARHIFLMATHTHAGPAHYFGSRQYAGGFSSREPGYDPAVLGFLADRIAEAVAKAFHDLVPARAAWVFDWGTKDIQRNRSLSAYLQNPESAGPAPPHQGCAGTFTEAGSEARRFVDQQLAVLRLLRAEDAAPIGVLAVFGLHNTAIANTNDLYHGDVFGFAVREVEERISRARCFREKERRHRAEKRPGEVEACSPHEWHTMFPTSPVVVGIANGIEGDVSPAVDDQTPPEALRLGRKLASEICKGFALSTDCDYLRPDEERRPTLADVDCARHPGPLPEASADIVLRRLYRELELPGKPTRPAPSAAEHLCPRPALGTAAAGGADDGPTRLRFFPAMNAGARRSRAEGACHGWKLPLGNPVSEEFADDGSDFPSRVPLGLLRIGPAVLATAPAELTTMVGRDVRSRIGRALNGAVPEGNVAVVGLTNAYIQYVTTPAEYALQRYEGASTLYGPRSAEFFAMHFECLARRLAGEPLPGACLLDQTIAVDDDSRAPKIAAHAISRMPAEEKPRPEPPCGELVVTPWTTAALSTEAEDLTAQRGASPGAPPKPDYAYPLSKVSQPRWQVSFAGGPSGRVRVRIVDALGRWIDDDEGRALEVRYDDEADGGKWTITWRPGFALPQPGWQERQKKPSPPWCDTQVRFEISGPRALRSQLFSVDTGCARSRGAR